jgi:hypothetical protein
MRRIEDDPNCQQYCLRDAMTLHLEPDGNTLTLEELLYDFGGEVYKDFLPTSEPAFPRLVASLHEIAPSAFQKLSERLQ